MKKRYALLVAILACVPSGFFLSTIVLLFVLSAAFVAALYGAAVTCAWAMDKAQRIADERRRRRGTPPLQF